MLQFALMLSTLLTALMLLIHAQPADSSVLHDFLAAPDGCPAPCFMGIRPGITSTDQAIHLLRNHEWVRGVDWRSNPKAIYIHWSSAPPGYINTQPVGVLNVENRLVRSIQIETRIPLSELWVQYGPADWGQSQQFGSPERRNTVYTLGYQEPGLAFRFVVPQVHWLGKLDYLLGKRLILWLEASTPTQAYSQPALRDLLYNNTLLAVTDGR